MPRQHRRLAARAVLTAGALGLTTLGPLAAAPATAAPAGVLTAPAPSGLLAAPLPDPDTPAIREARAKLADLETRRAAAQQRLDAATAKVAEGERRLADVQREVETTQARLADALEDAGALAAATYRSGPTVPSVMGMVLADDPAAFLHGTAVVERVNDKQGRVVDVVRDLTEQLEADRARQAAVVEQLQADRAAVETEKAAVARQVAAQQQVLDRLEEEERQRLLAEQRARQAAEEAARRERARQAAAASAQRAQQEAQQRASEQTGRGTARASRGSGRSAPAPTGGGGCPASRGAESGLQPNALRVMRCGLAAFPGVGSALGRGSRPNASDHGSGRAVDFMIPRYSTASGKNLGWAVAEWAIKQPGVTYVIWDQKYNDGSGWRQMGNRGSDTANHLDHVHVSTS